MTDYEDLVKSLRVCGKSLEAAAFPEWDVCLYTRAADAIEELQAELQRMVEAEINECNRRIATAQVNAKLAKNYWSPPKEETE